MEKLVTIELFGQPYTFKAEPDVSTPQEVAEILVREVNKIQSEQPTISSNFNKIAVLISAALNIANKNVELKKSNIHLANEISKKSESILNLIDKNISSFI